MSDSATLLTDAHQPTRSRAIGRVGGLIAAARSVVRACRLLWARRPGTPLRILCIAALDLVHRLRCQVPLPDETPLALATLLDYGALANARLDHKVLLSDSVAASDLALRAELQAFGLTELAEDYGQQLQLIEAHRPHPGGDVDNFFHVQKYREAVAELALSVLVAVAFQDRTLAAGIRAVRDDDTLQLLFRIVMQCQILDDFWDASHDQRLQLPSFFTAAPLHAQGLTQKAASVYGDLHTPKIKESGDFALRVSLRLLTALVQGHLWCSRLSIFRFGELQIDSLKMKRVAQESSAVLDT